MKTENMSELDKRIIEILTGKKYNALCEMEERDEKLFAFANEESILKMVELSKYITDQLKNAFYDGIESTKYKNYSFSDFLRDEYSIAKDQPSCK